MVPDPISTNPAPPDPATPAAAAEEAEAKRAAMASRLALETFAAAAAAHGAPAPDASACAGGGTISIPADGVAEIVGALDLALEALVEGTERGAREAIVVVLGVRLGLRSILSSAGAQPA